MKQILFITNGHGEDLVAAQIIRELADKRIKIDVLPVVGSGSLFKELDVTILGPKNMLPGGGFGLRNYGFLLKDIFAGLFGNTIKQVNILRNSKYEYALVIGIGDAVPIIYSILTGCKFMFIGVNKSEYYRKFAFNYLSVEKRLLRKYCRLTIARDLVTAKALASYGIPTKYVGNPMMDTMQDIRRSGDRGIRGKKTIGFLPGTREDAYKNIEDFYKVMREIRNIDRKVRFLLSFPPTLSKAKLKKISKPEDLKVETTQDFNKVLKRSTIIIGLSGTANEQAAGLGIPVIAFPGRGAQFNRRFAHGQKELLGNALMLLPRKPSVVANEALALMRNRNKMLKMGAAGRQRMGGPGASKKIAELIKKEIRI